MVSLGGSRLKISPKKVIVRMPNWLGDAVMATPVLAELRKKYPHAELTAMAQNNVAILLQNDPHIDELKGTYHTIYQQLKEQTKELKNTQRELSVTRKQLSASDGGQDLLNKENSALKNQQKQEQEQLERSEVALAKVKNELAQLYHQMDDKLSHSKDQIRSIIDEKVRLSQEREHFKEKALSAHARLEEVKGLFSVAQEQKHQQKNHNDELIKIIRSKDQEMSKLREFEKGYRRLQETKITLENSLSEARKMQPELAAKGKVIEQQKTEISDYKEQLKQAEEDRYTLNQQKQTSKDRSATLSKELAATTERAETLQEQFEKEQRDLLLLREQHNTMIQQKNSAIKERAATLEALEREVDIAKQTLVRGLRESKEVESRYHDAISERATALANYQQLKDDSSRQDALIEKLEKQAASASAKEINLKTRIEYFEQSLQASKEHATALQSRIHSLEEENRTASNDNKQLQSDAEHLNNELGRFHTSISLLEQDLLVTEEVKQSLRKRCHELATAEEQAHDSLQQLQDRNITIETIKENKQQLEEKYSLLKEEYDGVSLHLEQAIDVRQEVEIHAQELSAALSERKNTLDKATKQQELLQAKHQNLTNNLNKATQYINERDENIKELQRHLRSKVKESTLLSERLEEKTLKLSDVHGSIAGYKSKITDLQSRLEQRQQQEKRLQDLLNESIKSAESQINKWEKKFFYVQEQLQDTEIRVQEYQRREEKYQQLEKLLSNLGNFMGNTHPLPFQDIRQKTTETGNSPKTTGEREHQKDESISATEQEGQGVAAVKEPKTTPENMMPLHSLLATGSGASTKIKETLF